MPGWRKLTYVGFGASAAEQQPPQHWRTWQARRWRSSCCCWTSSSEWRLQRRRSLGAAAPGAGLEQRAPDPRILWQRASQRSCCGRGKREVWLGLEKDLQGKTVVELLESRWLRSLPLHCQQHRKESFVPSLPACIAEGWRRWQRSQVVLARPTVTAEVGGHGESQWQPGNSDFEHSSGFWLSLAQQSHCRNCHIAPAPAPHPCQESQTPAPK
mmetsp:Transcript_15332/g.33144  ORF Transcript_15332/g.33144 Transcript_15332/m.33144 type:complete len:213 (-) Transcript_15332:703-1341(-)